jgi:hypothetical protein
MSKLKSLLGTVWALAAVPLLLVMFMGFAHWPGVLVAATGLHVSPWYTGGEVTATFSREAYETRFHRPVFDALIGQRSRGFVQVDFVPAKGAALPAVIEDTLQPGGDHAMEFRLRLDTATRKATIEPLGARVLGLYSVNALAEGLAVRVALQNAH